MEHLDQYILRDKNGNIKEHLYENALKEVRLKDLDYRILPRQIGLMVTSPGSELADVRIDSIAKLTDEEIKKYFQERLNKQGEITRPILNNLRDLLNVLENRKDDIYRAYIKKQKVVLLQNIDLDTPFLKALDLLVEELTYLSNNSALDDSEAFQVNLIKLFFQGKSFSEIGKIIERTGETARTGIKEGNLVKNIINKETEIVINPVFYVVYEEFLKNYLNNDNIVYALDNFSELDQFIIKNKLDFLGLNLVSRVFLNRRDLTFLSAEIVTSIQPYYVLFLRFISTVFHPMQKDQLFERFQEYYKNQKDFNPSYLEDEELFMSLLNSSFIEQTFDEEIEDDLYCMKWEELSSQSLRIGSILYAVGEEMPLQEIYEEYNKRCSVYELEPLQSMDKLNIVSTDYILNTQNGYWKFKEDGDKSRPLATVAIDDFLKSHNGKATFNEIKSFLEAKGYKHTDKSIRAYAVKVARPALSDSNLFIHHDWIERTGISVLSRRNALKGAYILEEVKEGLLKLTENITISDFISEVSNRYYKIHGERLKSTYFKYYIDKFEDLTSLTIEGDVILASTVKKEEIIEIEYRSEPGYRKEIISGAIALLKKVDNKKLYHSEIYEELIELFPKDVSITNWYKVFQNSDYFIKGKDENNRVFYTLNEKELPQPEPSPFIQQDIDVVADFDTAKAFEPSMQYGHDNFELEETRRKQTDIFSIIQTELTRSFRNEGWIESGVQKLKSILSPANGEMSLLGKNLVYSLERVLANPSDSFDRDNCMMRLVLSFEPFLKKILNTPENGLGNLIHTIKSLVVLKEYKDENRGNYEQRRTATFRLSVSLNSLMYFRNKFAHDGGSEDLDFSITDHFKYIMDFVSLYVFTGVFLDDN